MSKLEDLLAKQRRLENQANLAEVDQVPTPAVEPSLVGQVQDNLAEIAILGAEQDVLRVSTQRETHQLEYDVYQPKIRQLEDERDQAIQVVRETAEQALDQKRGAIEGLYVVINQVRRILEFLQVKTTKDLTIDDDDVKSYEHREKVNLGYLFDDDYLKIKLFIVENRKPKNKRSLIAMGRCLFGEHLLKLGHGYVEGIQGGGFFSLEAVIVDKPSEAELQPWLADSRRQQLIISLTGDYEGVKAEYLDVIGTYTPEDFKELMTDRCGCGYFYTILDNISRRHETVTCPLCQSVMERVGGV